MSTCGHNVTIKGLCADCGKDLHKLNIRQTTSVSMVHSVPELRVSEAYARQVGKDDQMRLIKDRKLVLVVDLDQTIIHTTHNKVANDPSIHKFCLWPGHPTYYTKLRPFLDEFLERMDKIYELHIFTFGCRLYAHKIADIIDSNKKYFSHRILSRDESVDQMSKRGNLKDLFPCGDSMVCIIDDRSDVWNNARNLVQVKPYVYFKSTGDINSPYPSGNNKTQPEQSSTVETLSTGVKRSHSDEPANESKRLKTDCQTGDEQNTCENTVATKETSENDEPSDSSNSSPKSMSGSDDDSDSNDDSLDDDVDELEALINQDDNKVEVLHEDFDSHLLLLAERLEEIHAKFYEELDERVKYLSENEQYMLPDLKEIIPMVMRQRFSTRRK